MPIFHYHLFSLASLDYVSVNCSRIEHTGKSWQADLAIQIPPTEASLSCHFNVGSGWTDPDVTDF